MLRPEQNGWKLVRHKMPGNSEKPMIVRDVEGEEHVQFLLWKFVEEVGEILDAKNDDELALEIADARQVLLDFCTVAQIPPALVAPTRPYERIVKYLPEDKGDREQIAEGVRGQLRVLAEQFLVDAQEHMRVAIVGVANDLLDTLTAAKDVRDKTEVGRASKLAERGGFIPGIAWKVAQENV